MFHAIWHVLNRKGMEVAFLAALFAVNLAVLCRLAESWQVVVVLFPLIPLGMLVEVFLLMALVAIVNTIRGKLPPQRQKEKPVTRNGSPEVYAQQAIIGLLWTLDLVVSGTPSLIAYCWLPPMSQRLLGTLVLLWGIVTAATLVFSCALALYAQLGGDPE